MAMESLDATVRTRFRTGRVVLAPVVRSEGSLARQPPGFAKAAIRVLGLRGPPPPTAGLPGVLLASTAEPGHLLSRWQQFQHDLVPPEKWQCPRRIVKCQQRFPGGLQFPVCDKFFQLGGFCFDSAATSKPRKRNYGETPRRNLFYADTLIQGSRQSFECPVFWHDEPDRPGTAFVLLRHRRGHGDRLLLLLDGGRHIDLRLRSIAAKNVRRDTPETFPDRRRTLALHGCFGNDQWRVVPDLERSRRCFDLIFRLFDLAHDRPCGSGCNEDNSDDSARDPEFAVRFSGLHQATTKDYLMG